MRALPFRRRGKETCSEPRGWKVAPPRSALCSWAPGPCFVACVARGSGVRLLRPAFALGAAFGPANMARSIAPCPMRRQGCLLPQLAEAGASQTDDLVSYWVWRGLCGGVRTSDPASLLLRQLLLHFFSPSRTELLSEVTPSAVGSYPSAPKGLLSSPPRPPPLPSVPRDRGEAPYMEQSRRGAQPSCHPGLAGLRRPKRGGPE